LQKSSKQVRSGKKKKRILSIDFGPVISEQSRLVGLRMGGESIWGGDGICTKFYDEGNSSSIKFKKTEHSVKIGEDNKIERGDYTGGTGGKKGQGGKGMNVAGLPCLDSNMERSQAISAAKEGRDGGSPTDGHIGAEPQERGSLG